MKNILIIHHGWGIGGGLIAMVHLVHELKNSYNVRILCVFDSEAVGYLKMNGFEVEIAHSKFYRNFYSLFIHSSASYCSIQNFLKQIYSLCMYFFNMYYFASRELEKHIKDVDLIYLNSLFLSDWAKAAKEKDKKVVIHVREPLAAGLFSMRKKIIQRNIENYTDSIVAISRDNAIRLNVLYKTFVVYDPVCCTRHSSPLCEQINDDFIYFTYVGGEQRIKGFEQLAHSLDYLDEKIRIFFIGSSLSDTPISFANGIRCILSSYYRNLSSLKLKVRNSKNVILLGYREDVFAYYQLSRSIISPFAKPHASLPILEALSVGKPVIASDVDGTRELVNDSVGVIYKNGDFRALANAINEMALVSDDELKQFNENARMRYLDIMSKTNSVLKIIYDCFVKT